MDIKHLNILTAFCTAPLVTLGEDFLDVRAAALAEKNAYRQKQ